MVLTHVLKEIIYKKKLKINTESEARGIHKYEHRSQVCLINILTIILRKIYGTIRLICVKVRFIGKLILLAIKIIKENEN